MRCLLAVVLVLPLIASEADPASAPLRPALRGDLPVPPIQLVGLSLIGTAEGDENCDGIASEADGGWTAWAGGRSWRFTANGAAPAESGSTPAPQTPKLPDPAGGRGSSVLTGDDGVVYSIGYRQLLPLLQGPYISAWRDGKPLWKLWDFDDKATTGKQLMADSRGTAIARMSDGRLAVAMQCDGGNSVLLRDPRDIGKGNPALANGWRKSYGSGGGGMVTMLGVVSPEGVLEAATFVHATLRKTGKTNTFSPRRVACDDQNRVWVLAASAHEAPATIVYGDKPVGATLAVFTPDLSRLLWCGCFGSGTAANDLLIHDNLVLVGGDFSGEDRPFPLQGRKAHKPFGKKDGFVAAFRIGPRKRVAPAADKVPTADKAPAP